MALGSVFLGIIMPTIIIVFFICPSNVNEEYGNLKRLKNMMYFGIV